MLFIPFVLSAETGDTAKELQKIERVVIEWKRENVHKILARRVIDAIHHLERVLVEEAEVVSTEDFREWYRVIYLLEAPGEAVFKTHEITWFLQQTHFFLRILENDAAFLKTFHFTFRNLVYLYDETYKSLLVEYQKTNPVQKTAQKPVIRKEEKAEDRRILTKREHLEWQRNYQRVVEAYYREWVVRRQPERAREARRFQFGRENRARHKR